MIGRGYWLGLAWALWLLAGPVLAQAPAARPAPPETRRYAIEVAGVRVGTMTATRAPQTATTDAVFTLTSDVKVNFLVYNLKIYYQVVNRVRNGQLLLSTVEAHTNQGDFASRTEWKGDHYDIVADQYKHHYRATEKQPIRYTVTDMFFGEPQGQTRAFAEYFGDFFTVQRTAAGKYKAERDGREDEYQYANGELVVLIKKNPLKNFIIRLL
ncbi:DUF6134 family protein [Hymenobacter canadensis]|uniref:DUF3108 domain-containing protein n=1 Tax=Hymenobacter canadensis TaxID=2999067 RepID=A0ABY7LUJ0_9BACT|nr:DUF6134 family protein [Hymenobacter canadensis]WBA43529.1 hypothetical protein O3303_08160 [Hymenobacter canadensis]